MTVRVCFKKSSKKGFTFGRNLGMKNIFLYQLVETVIDVMGESFPEIEEKKSHIINVIKSEEESFNKTLDNGLEVFEQIINNLGSDNIKIIDAFRLYDTYGFPFDLTRLMANEKNINVDEKGFNICMEEQKLRSRASSDFKMENDEVLWNEVKDIKSSNFIGYEHSESNSGLLNLEN